MPDVAPIVVFREQTCAHFGSAIDDRDAKEAFNPETSDHWRARERAERAAAKSARSAIARAVHQELAQEYSARVRELERNGRRASAGQR